MRFALTLSITLTTLASTSDAQILAIPAMTQPHTVLDMDRVGAAGTTTLAAINASSSRGPSPLLGLSLVPNLSGNGTYNFNTAMGLGLGLDAQSRFTLVPIGGAYVGFDAVVIHNQPVTEFGLSIGDNAGGVRLEFRRLGVFVGGIVSTTYSSPAAKFFRSALPFDEVLVQPILPAGNWVIPELHLQNGYGFRSFAPGCQGSAGVPNLANTTPPWAGTSFRLQVGNLPPGGGTFGLAIGFSTVFSPALGPLPFDLSGYGAPGCMVAIDPVSTLVTSYAGSTGNITWSLPPAAFLGLQFHSQAFVLDMGANTFGLTLSNACTGVVQ